MRSRVLIVLASLAVVLSLSSARAAEEPDSDVPYTVTDKPWDAGLGHHRCRLVVSAKAPAVAAEIAWRRRDGDAARKNLILIDLATGRRVKNLLAVEVNREVGRIVFEPPAAGEYVLYYLPYKVQTGYGGYGGDYTPREQTAEAAWLQTSKLTGPQATETWKSLPRAKVAGFEARTAFDSFYPMEVVATAAERRAMLDKHAGKAFLLFPEDRRFPIRMVDDLPLRWTRRGPAATFAGQAQPNEYYAFQVGVLACRDLKNVDVAFGPLQGPGGAVIPASSLRCFNLGGVGWDGKAFRKTLNVPAGTVQALWIGLDLPRDAAGEYRGKLTIKADGTEPAEVALSITAAGPVLEDRGDGEPWRHSRLHWLDSTGGSGDTVVPPYTPLRVDAATSIVECLGRSVRLNPTGLPDSIRCGDQQILAEPIRLTVQGGGPVAVPSHARVVEQSPGRIVWQAAPAAPAGPEAEKTSADSSANLKWTCRSTMEFDGHLDFEITLTALREVALDDVTLVIPLRKEAATYLMGIGRKGGLRPPAYTWKWAGPYDSFWIGDVWGGLHCELRGGSYHGPMINLYHPAPPPSWHNGGRGSVSVAEAPGGQVHAAASTGPRKLAAGEELKLEFALLITPVKPLDTAWHFRNRIYHDPKPKPEDLKAGVNILNVHHANEINPYINYPFIAVEPMRQFVRAWHEKGLKVKIYYTLRELSNYVTEMWALRSLGSEVLADGPGGGFPWLREHLVNHYQPSWYSPYADGTADASIVNSGQSRWYNYYVESLGWLARNVQIDGLYLDDVSYDRTILRRMRRVFQANRPGMIIDLHSNTAFSIGPANQYAEFFPYVDRLWFGESFQYNKEGPDYWLTEISGIPFGLMGEMLQDGGNPWRGMIYGMTARLPWSEAPRPMFELWDSFGIDQARMVGYWQADCPVRTDRPDVLATAYVRPGRTLVSLASWAPQAASCNLRIDWKALGLDASQCVLRAPAIKGLQEARVFQVGEAIPVQPMRGWLLLVEPK